MDAFPELNNFTLRLQLFASTIKIFFATGEKNVKLSTPDYCKFLMLCVMKYDLQKKFSMC